MITAGASPLSTSGVCSATEVNADFLRKRFVLNHEQDAQRVASLRTSRKPSAPTGSGDRQVHRDTSRLTSLKPIAVHEIMRNRSKINQHCLLCKTIVKPYAHLGVVYTVVEDSNGEPTSVELHDYTHASARDELTLLLPKGTLLGIEAPNLTFSAGSAEDEADTIPAIVCKEPEKVHILQSWDPILKGTPWATSPPKTRAVDSSLASNAPLELTPEELRIDGNREYAAGRFAQAVKLYQLAVDMDPSIAALHGNLAQTYLQMKQFKDALKCAEQALLLEPGNEKHARRRDMALESIKKASTPAPAASTTASKAEAGGASTSGLNVCMEQTAEEVRLEGNAAFKSGDWKSAEARYVEAIHMDPSCTSAHSNLSQTYLAMDLPEKAMKSAAAGLSLEPLNEKCMVRLVKSLMKLRNFREAMDAIASFPASSTSASVALQTLATELVQRLNEMDHGAYDWKNIIFQLGLNPFTPLDLADFTSPLIRMGSQPGKRKTLPMALAAETIPMGTTLMVCRATAVAPAHPTFVREPGELNKNLGKAIKTQMARDSRVKIPPTKSPYKMKVVSEYHDMALRHGLQLQPTYIPVPAGYVDIETVPCGNGVWLLTKIFKHSCVPNTTRQTFSDFMVVTAAVDIPAGDAITFCHVALEGDYDLRSGILENRALTCECSRCRDSIAGRDVVAQQLGRHLKTLPLRVKRQDPRLQDEASDILKEMRTALDGVGAWPAAPAAPTSTPADAAAGGKKRRWCIDDLLCADLIASTMGTYFVGINKHKAAYTWYKLQHDLTFGTMSTPPADAVDANIVPLTTIRTHKTGVVALQCRNAAKAAGMPQEIIDWWYQRAQTLYAFTHPPGAFAALCRALDDLPPEGREHVQRYTFFDPDTFTEPSPPATRAYVLP